MKYQVTLLTAICLMAAGPSMAAKPLPKKAAPATAPRKAVSAAPAASKEELAKISAVVEGFRTAIIAKDKEKFLKLFVRDGITWIGIKDSASLALHKAHYPDSKERKAPPNDNHLSFIGYIVGTPAPTEEKFSNVQIDSDGEIATVRFDYSFHVNGKMNNWGKEAWQLVNTEEGWKIASVVWSARFPPEPAPPVRKEIALAPAQLEPLVGSYELRPGSALAIELDGDHLRVTQRGAVFPLYALSATRFFDKAFGPVYEFKKDDTGAVTGVDIELDGQTFTATRK